LTFHGKVAVVKDDLPVKVVDSLAKNERVELLSVEEVHQRVMTETKTKIRKRSQ